MQFYYDWPIKKVFFIEVFTLRCCSLQFYFHSRSFLISPIQIDFHSGRDHLDFRLSSFLGLLRPGPFFFVLISLRDSSAFSAFFRRFSSAVKLLWVTTVLLSACPVVVPFMSSGAHVAKYLPISWLISFILPSLPGVQHVLFYNPILACFILIRRIFSVMTWRSSAFRFNSRCVYPTYRRTYSSD